MVMKKIKTTGPITIILDFGSTTEIDEFVVSDKEKSSTMLYSKGNFVLSIDFDSYSLKYDKWLTDNTEFNNRYYKVVSRCF